MNQVYNHNFYELFKDIIIPLFASLLTFVALFVAILTLKSSLKVAQANFEFQMSVSHRDTWRYILDNDLKRIKKVTASAKKITEMELLNINFVLINVKTTFDARKRGVLPKHNEHLFMKDVGEFFSFPLPERVWQKMSKFYEDDFKQFMHNSVLVFKGEPLPKKGIRKIYQQIKIKFTNTIKKIKNYSSNEKKA